MSRYLIPNTQMWLSWFYTLQMVWADGLYTICPWTWPLVSVYIHSAHSSVASVLRATATYWSVVCNSIVYHHVRVAYRIDFAFAPVYSIKASYAAVYYKQNNLDFSIIRLFEQ